MAKSRQLAIELLLKDKKALSQLRSALGKVDKQSKKTTKQMIPQWLKVAAVVAGVTIVTKKLINATIDFGKAIINTTANFESYRIELQAFVGTAEAAQDKLNELIEFSVKTPFTPEQVIKAGKLLAPLEKLGFKMNDLLKASGNAAVTFGLTMEQSALQMVRIFTAGIGAADLFRDRGVRSFIEIERNIDLTTLSMEDLRDTMLDALTTGEIGKGIERLSKTFKGLQSTLEGEIQDALRIIGEAGFLDVVKADLEDLLFIIKESKKEGGNYAEVIDRISDSYVKLWANTKIFLVGTTIGLASLIDNWNKFKSIIVGIEAAFLQLTLAGRLLAGSEVAGIVSELRKEAERLGKSDFAGKLKKQFAELEATFSKARELRKFIEELRQSAPDLGGRLTLPEDDLASVPGAGLGGQALSDFLDRDNDLIFEKIFDREAILREISDEALAQESKNQQEAFEQFFNIEDMKIQSVISSTEIVKQIKQEALLDELKAKEAAIKKEGVLEGNRLKQLQAVQQAIVNVETAGAKAKFQTQIQFAMATADLTDAVAVATGKSSIKAVGIVIRAVIQAINIAMLAVNPFLAILNIAVTAVSAANALSQLKAAEKALEAQRGQSIQAVTNVQGLAGGTPRISRAGVFDVGERGTERVFLPAGAAVQNNREMKDSGGVTNIFHFHGDVLDLGDFRERFEEVVGSMASKFIEDRREDFG